MMQWFGHITPAVLIGLSVLLLSACSHTRYLAEDEELYTGAELDIESDHSIDRKTDIHARTKEVIRPEPNTTFLGMRPGLWLYHIAGTPKKDKGIRHFIKYKLGEPPVLYEEANPDFVQQLIENRLNNNGFFNARVDYEIERNQQKVALKYKARVQRAYVYDSIFYRLDSSAIAQTIRDISEESLIESGQQYTLKSLRDERKRIERSLKNKGYYYFNQDYINIQADTTGGDEQTPYEIDLFIGLQNNLPDRATRQYRINEISVFPNYQLGEEEGGVAGDTVYHKGYVFVNRESKMNFRPRAVASKINLKPGELYSRDAHEWTIKRTMGMGAFKFVDVQLKEAENTASALLNGSVYMTPMAKKTISARLTLVSKSNNYAGPGLELGWVNRNLFGGAERLQIDASGGFETQFGGRSTDDVFSNFRSYQFNTSVGLAVPGFLIPFSDKVGRRFTPETRFKAGYELVNRVKYFRLSSLSFSSGYYWNETAEKEHELNPLVVQYVSLDHVTDDFQSILDENPFLERSLAEQYILGPEYTYTYNNQVDPDLDNHIYFTASASFSNPFDWIKGDISTYYRLNGDFRYYYRFSESSKLVARIAGGMGIPYGGSESLPYVKQFFTGGPNSIRAFRARTVGPGTVPPPEQETGIGFQDQNGNIKLEANLEYRFDIYGIVKGALFADAGNIWLHEEDANQAGGTFSSEDVLSELAVGAGLGLRLDISYFVLRFDLAWPIRKPYLPDGERWVHPFRGQRPVLNVSIGYPF